MVLWPTKKLNRQNEYVQMELMKDGWVFDGLDGFGWMCVGQLGGVPLSLCLQASSSLGVIIYNWGYVRQKRKLFVFSGFWFFNEPCVPFAQKNLNARQKEKEPLMDDE